ncbi:Druantia anti-phage system protein DruA [Rhizobium sp. BK251]|uniref:Druantia anti-phage system protein DruA n=1 Tax=Rhizobium sp. BK251 TaxID=2512125 RepID=UPI00104F7598|nr:Druantia anti-phage system protein DruA [Rhizobium sp. BK251]
MTGPGRVRAFSPFLAPDEKEQLRALLDFGDGPPPSFAGELRDLARRYVDDGESRKLRAICLLVADLFEQGWRVSVDDGRIQFEPPGISRFMDQTVEDVKARVRSALQTARQRQLKEPSVVAFLRSMERRALRKSGHHSSVLDLIDDGDDLAKSLEKANDLSGDARSGSLAHIIDPVVEICEAGRKCEHTGLNLIDIWRYFRHTWAHEYRPVPGRQMLILVRNAARPKHPVIGIAMLASPVMRVNVRDRWIGWLREETKARLDQGLFEPNSLATALLSQLETSIASIRFDDLVRADEVAEPSEATVLRLEQKAAGAAYARDMELRAHFEVQRAAGASVSPLKGAVKTNDPKVDWKASSEDLLFVRKRAEVLAQLLFARQMFRASNLATDPARALDQLLAGRSGQRAVDIVLTECRKAGLSSRIADVSVCGAVAPYNELLGGKLVALLLASREVRIGYEQRYSGQVSVIASQMAGRPVSKPADLRILTTTSLYGIGSSQYNRLALKAEDHAGLTETVAWKPIGTSLTGGYGTLHLGADTANALRSMAQSRHFSRRINNRFGEGTSPRLRQMREGLDALGLDSDTILHHATPRLFYACELGSKARDVLLGLASTDARGDSAGAIANAWRTRWLDARSRRPDTLAKLRLLGPASVQCSLHISDGSDLFNACV